MATSLLQEHAQEQYNPISDRWIDWLLEILAKQRCDKDTPREPPFVLSQEARSCLSEVVGAQGRIPVYASPVSPTMELYVLKSRPIIGSGEWQQLFRGIYTGLHKGSQGLYLARRIVQRARNRMAFDFGFRHHKPYDDDEVCYFEIENLCMF